MKEFDITTMTEDFFGIPKGTFARKLEVKHDMGTRKFGVEYIESTHPAAYSIAEHITDQEQKWGEPRIANEE